ncbi:MAG: nucleoside hydrolase [Ilumatobacteraceae bacterium]
MSERPAIILDCDPGHDDALALAVAARFTELVGVTTVSGNVGIESTTRNARVVLDLVAPEVDVHRGAARPLIVEPFFAEYVHGESGLDGADLPAPSRAPASDDAVAYLIETCRRREGLWLVPTGPLTNIALALRQAPDLAERIAGISLMGGGSFGNTTAAAEFNFFCDPHAAAIVMDYGGPLIMAGLDVTHRFQATPPRIERLRALPGRVPQLFAELLTFFSGTYVSRHDVMGGAAMHDVCAVLAITHPELFTADERHVAVETDGAITRGMSLIDERRLIDRPASNTRVLRTIDADAAFELLVESMPTA